MGYSMLTSTRSRAQGPGGVVRFVRRELGVEAFGVNWFELPPDAEGPSTTRSTTGQEEVNVVVAAAASTGSTARRCRSPRR